MEQNKKNKIIKDLKLCVLGRKQNLDIFKVNYAAKFKKYFFIDEKHEAEGDAIYEFIDDYLQKEPIEKYFKDPNAKLLKHQILLFLFWTVPDGVPVEQVEQVKKMDKSVLDLDPIFVESHRASILDYFQKGQDFIESLDKDHYKTLGVDPGASDDKIRKAYLALAKKYHSDRSKDETLIQIINHAHDILSDSEKRAKYDKSRAHKPPRGHVHQPMPKPGTSRSRGAMGNSSALFSQKQLGKSQEKSKLGISFSDPSGTDPGAGKVRDIIRLNFEDPKINSKLKNGTFPEGVTDLEVKKTLLQYSCRGGIPQGNDNVKAALLQDLRCVGVGNPEEIADSWLKEYAFTDAANQAMPEVPECAIPQRNKYGQVEALTTTRSTSEEEAEKMMKFMLDQCYDQPLNMTITDTATLNGIVKAIKAHVGEIKLGEINGISPKDATQLRANPKEFAKNFDLKSDPSTSFGR